MKALLLCLALTLSAEARLGETIAECKARYGTILEKWENEGWIRFGIGMVRVECTFSEGKCGIIEYQLANADGSPAEYDQRFNDDARARLLLANQGASRFLPWKPEHRHFLLSTDAMKTEDGARCVYIESTRIRFEDLAFIEARRKALTPEAIRDHIKGF